MSEPNVLPLTEHEVPALNAAQLALFTSDTIHSEAVMPFEVQEAADRLRSKEATFVLAADFGGDKGAVRLYKITDGALVVDSGYVDDIQGDLGRGYLDTLRRAANYAETHAIPFGISWGAPLHGTKPLYHPKAEVFLQEIQAEFDGDFSNISPTIKSVINDGPAGAISGAVAALRQFGSHNLIFIINGGGINTATVINGQLYSNETGHIEALADLNTYNQSTPCGVFGAEFVCLERVGANKAGIEAQWQAKTGAYMRARDIEDQYKAGDSFAGELYDHSAWVVSHIVVGAAQASGLDLTSPDTAVVAHGGAFKFPNYGARIAQIVGNYLGAELQLLMAKDYIAAESNACLDGAAIAAAYNS